MNRTYLLLIFLVCIVSGALFFFCISNFRFFQKLHEIQHGSYTNATVRVDGIGIVECYPELEGGGCDIVCVYCEPKNYSILYPLNLPEEFKKNNTEIEFVAEICPEIYTSVQRGIPAKILNVSGLSASSKEKIISEILKEMSELENEVELIENETQ